MASRREDFEEERRLKALADLAELQYDRQRPGDNLKAAEARMAVLQGRDREPVDPVADATQAWLRRVGLGLAIALIAYVIYGVASVYL